MCTRCHGPGGIKESLSFTSYEAIKPWALAIRAQVEMRAMPPWQAGGGCADYAFDESLTEDEIATVISWADAGAPQGDPSGDVNEMRTVTFAQLTREDVSIEMPVPYLPQIAPDDYRCFLVEWPKDTTQFITGFGARPGNPAVVHHIIAYLVYPEATDTFRAWDDAEEGPGYTCFGGPSGPGGGVSGFGKSTRFIGGWAPGGVGADFPAGTGMRVPPGSLIALQVHYNTLGVGPEEDQTRVVFKVDDQVEKEAFVIPWTNFQWLAGIGMEIPAGQKEVTHAYSGSPLDFGLLNGATALRLYTATLHMHTLGVRGSVAIRRADGTSECLVEYPRYDFNWQRSFGFETPKLLKKGDKIEIECTWDNSAEHQPIFGGTQLEPHDVHWGEGTTDEMCIAFFYATIE